MSDRPSQGKRRKSPGSVAALDDAGEDEIFARVASGEPIGRISQDYGLSRDVFYKWVKRGGSTREAAMAEARSQSAHAHAEIAGEILEVAKSPKTTGEAQIAKARADHHRWFAERFGRDTYGDTGAQVNVQLDIGKLHLEALMAHGSMTRLPPALPVLEARTVTQRDVVDDADDGE